MTETTIGLVVLRSSNVEGSLAFYRAIGLVFIEEKHGSGPVHFSCRLGTIVIEIYPGSDQEPQDYRGSGATLLGFKVVSIDAVLETIQAMGADVLTPPKRSAWGRRAVVKDPDGRAVELTE